MPTFSPPTSILPVKQSSSHSFLKDVQNFSVSVTIAYVLYPALKAKQLPSFINITMVHCLFLCRQQKCQMNVNICYWDGGKNVAQSVYYDSQFLQMSNAVNLKKEVLNAIKDLDMGKFLHLGMDEPRTNWNVLDLITDNQVAIGFQKTWHWFLLVA